MMLPPKPTFLMLWSARAYAVFVLVRQFTNLVIYSSEPDRVVISGSPASVTSAHGQMLTATQTITHFHSGPTASLYFYVILFACLTCGLFALNRLAARLVVGAAAIICLVMSVFGVVYLAYLLVIANQVATAFLHVKFPLILLSSVLSAGFQTVNIWLALRPPVSNRHDNDDRSPQFGRVQAI